MILRKFVLILTLLVCLAGVASAQGLPSLVYVPLSIDEGFPFQLRLTEKLRYRENEPVHAKLVEPVYAFDRVVIPAGTEVVGRITRLRKAGAGKRVASMVTGDFSPQNQPAIRFDTLILADGSRIPIETSVSLSTDSVARFAPGKSGLLKDAADEFRPTAEKSSKGTKDLLWSLSPYRPQSLPAGTRLKAVLDAPVPMGAAIVGKASLSSIGSRPSEESIVAARLVTSLESRKSKPGDLVNAVLTRPLFSNDHRLLFPAGSVMRGEVLSVRAARSFHRNGELNFRFNSIEPPALELVGTFQEREIVGKVAGLHVGTNMTDLRMAASGDTRIVESKMRFLGPAYAAVKAGYALNASADAFSKALPNAYIDSFINNVVGGRSGFGLVGSVSAAMIPPVGIGLAFYGVAGSIYANFLGRGHDIQLPADTSIEIQLDDTGSTQ